MNMASLGFVASVRKSCYTCCCCCVVTAAFPELVSQHLCKHPQFVWHEVNTDLNLEVKFMYWPPTGGGWISSCLFKIKVLSQAQLEWTTPAVCHMSFDMTWHGTHDKLPAGRLNWIVDLEWLWNVPFSGVNGNWFAHVSLRDGRYRIKFYNSIPIPQLGYSVNSSNCQKFVKRSVLYK